MEVERLITELDRVQSEHTLAMQQQPMLLNAAAAAAAAGGGGGAVNPTPLLLQCQQSEMARARAEAEAESLRGQFQMETAQLQTEVRRLRAAEQETLQSCREEARPLLPLHRPLLLPNFLVIVSSVPLQSGALKGGR